ncbi:hypothetical protein AB1285_25170 [Microbacterium sp. NRRL B-14842]|uniref:hypothetical protein n=1 Tax=Microbacterium sp. NRRL B-14842 TaxID=3162881 RepID=UPI003D276827
MPPERDPRRSSRSGRTSSSCWRREIDRARARGDEDGKVEQALRHLSGVLLHTPTVRAHELAAAGRADEFAAALATLYGIAPAATRSKTPPQPDPVWARWEARPSTSPETPPPDAAERERVLRVDMLMDQRAGAMGCARIRAVRAWGTRRRE